MSAHLWGIVALFLTEQYEWEHSLQFNHSRTFLQSKAAWLAKCRITHHLLSISPPAFPVRGATLAPLTKKLPDKHSSPHVRNFPFSRLGNTILLKYWHHESTQLYCYVKRHKARLFALYLQYVRDTLAKMVPRAECLSRSNITKTAVTTPCIK